MKKTSKTILFLPFLQIPSGHHHAATALIDGIQEVLPEISCEKVDILGYSYGKIEALVSSIYLKWIQAFPQLYNFLYQSFVYKNIEQNKRYRVYEWLFLYFMKRLVKDRQPDLIICTHALPSYMLNHLKKKKELTIPVINVYTDYFIHQFWGVEYIDYHFVSTPEMESYLKRKGISRQNIFRTGIPIHQTFNQQQQPARKPQAPYTVLVCGGNLGVGAIEELIQKIDIKTNDITYYILCGKNKMLFDSVRRKQLQHIVPLPYIKCRKKMNELYDQVDAVITKPGGVTISECLCKKKPIFIFHALPGQEQINLEQLKKLKLVIPLQKKNIHEQILSILADEKELEYYFHQVETFHSQKNQSEPLQIITTILKGVLN